jgi:hypothetical protein
MKLIAEFWSDDILWDYADRAYGFKEQDLIVHTIFAHPHLRKRFGIAPQGMINAYGDIWHEGDVLVHFPACKYNLLLCLLISIFPGVLQRSV